MSNKEKVKFNLIKLKKSDCKNIADTLIQNAKDAEKSDNYVGCDHISCFLCDKIFNVNGISDGCKIIHNHPIQFEDILLTQLEYNDYELPKSVLKLIDKLEKVG